MSNQGKVLFKSSAKTVKEALFEALNARADMAQANLSGADLMNFALKGAVGAVLPQANLSRSNLSMVSIPESNFSGANMSHANLFGAKLRQSNFAGANLAGANFMKADLSNANFTGANLTGANLMNADLNGANFTDANMMGVNK